MKTLLELTGMAPYHATCLSPIIWAIVALALAAIYLIAGWMADRDKRQRRQVRRRRRSRM